MSHSPNGHILVVDDNPATRYATSRVLRSAGLTVVEAASGREALAKAADGPSLIVLDINLPDIDGFQVCRQLRSQPATRRTPVIYLSATFVDDIDKVQAVNVGGDGYLTHPVEPPVLIAAVNAFLRARQAEDAVQESEAKFTAVFDHAPNGIALLSEDLIFVDANRFICGIFGRERAEIVGRHISAFSPKDHDVPFRQLTDALAAAGQWRGNAPVLNAAGRLVDLEWSVSTLSVPNIRLAIVSDITQRKAIEAERERLLASEQLARAEAEEANRLKDEFLAALSHELRTPLNAIVGFCRVLQLRPTGPDAEASVNAIERNALVQAQLIADLLDISRITSGKLHLNRQAISPADAVDSALSSSQTAAKAKNVTLDVDLDRTCRDIWWDPSRFQQVVWNLVDNAVKFSSEGGIVHIRLVQTASSVDLEVKDHGRGISTGFLPHVFDRFRQEDSSTKRWHGGLGLGLAIVHQVVSAHGGTVSAASEGENLGATFVVRLPFMAETTVTGAEPRRDAVPRQLNGVRVLVVEDNEDARVLVSQILSHVSAEVLAVADVRAALAALDTFRPHVLVSDVGMPFQDGYDLIQQVRELGWSASRLPAIALTALARDDDRRRALNAGYQAHFAKPPDVSELLAEIARLCALAG